MGSQPRSNGGGSSPAVLAVLDWAISLLLLSPLCVFYWRGTWQLLDSYLFKGQLDMSGCVSVTLGYGFCWFCYAIQGELSAFLMDAKIGLWRRVIVARAYTFLFAFGLVNLWRGVWHLLDHFFGKSWESGAGSAAVGVVLLASLRALRNVMAPPLGLATDHLDREFAYCPTMFRTKEAKRSLGVFFVDVFFSVVVVGSLVVFFWRGIWTVLDVFVFPDSQELSAWSSLAIGYGIVLLSYAAQYQAAVVSRHLKIGWLRIAFEDAFILFASVGAINVWRGVWVFADVYIIPENYALSNGVTSVIGVLGSMLLFAGNNVLARGVYLDGESSDGSGCIVSGPYLRKILKRARHIADNEGGTRLEAIACLPMASACKINGDAWKENKPIQDGLMLIHNDGRSLGCPKAEPEDEVVERETMV